MNKRGRSYIKREPSLAIAPYVGQRVYKRARTMPALYRPISRRPTRPADEVKYFDTSLGLTNLTNTADWSAMEKDPATILCLNGVPQGDTAQSRDGMKICMKSIFIHGALTAVAQTAQSSADTAPNIFIALVLDKQTNAAQLNSEDVYTNPSGVTSLVPSPLRNMTFTDRFKVLKTVKVEVPQLGLVNDTGSTGGVIQNGITIPFTIAANLKMLQTKFTAGTTTGYCTTIQDNSLHLVACVSSTGYAMQILYNARLRYVG